MKRCISLVTVVATSLLWAACGSCTGPAEKAAPEALPPLAEASDPFANRLLGGEITVPSIALPAKAPLLIRMASTARVDELLMAYQRARTAAGVSDTAWGADSLLAKILQFDPAGWVAPDKPVTLLFLDPAKYMLGEVLVLGLQDTDALLRVLPKGTFDDEESPPAGHTAVYRAETGNVYVDFVGPNVVFTKHDKVFSQVRSFIASDLPAWEAGHDLDVIIDVSNIREAFAKEIALTREDPTPKGKRGSGVPFMSKAALLALADGFERVSAHIDLEDGHFKVQVAVTQRDVPAGAMTWITEWFKALSRRTTAPVAGLPTGTWAAASLSADLSAEAFLPLRAGASAALNSVYGDLLDLTPAEREASGLLWGRFADLLTGGGYAFAFEQGEVPACAAVVVRVEDADRARPSTGARFLTRRLLETFLLRIVPRIQDEEIGLGDMPFPDGDFRTVSELFEALNAVYQQVGIEFYESTLVEASQDIAVETLGVRLDSAVGKEAAKAGKDTLADILGDRVEIALAYRGNLVALVLSPAATNQAAHLVSGGFGKGSGPFRAVAPGESAISAVALDRLVTSVPRLWPNATDVMPADALRGDASLALKASDKTVQVTLSLPVLSIALLEAITKRRADEPATTVKKPKTP